MATAILLGGCDVGQKGDVRATGPSPVLMSTSLERYRQPDGSLRDVILRPHFVLRFSRPMSPSSVSRANFSISSTGGVGSVGFTNIRVDPMDRTIVFTVDAVLNIDTDYALEIHPSEDPRARLAAIDGAPFVGTVKIPFHTTRDATATTAEPLDVTVNPCVARDVLRSSCASACCHGSSGTSPVLGLSLAKGSLIQETAVGHAAIEVQDPASPGGPGTPVPRNFPYGMPIISPGSSAGSYLMYKILMRPPSGTPRNPTPFDPFVADVEEPAVLLANELSTRMIGAPMPHPERGFLDPAPGQTCSDGKPAGPLPWDAVQTIRRWIDQGAKACPCDESTPGDECDLDTPGGDAGVDAGDAGDAENDARDAAASDAVTDASDAGAD